ncbi:NAD(P)H-dependent flavin oxidoreductase [Georgenia thermotolerans]|uniref:Nitronate monooxygenase n=1 Tax=Georgenia thermotolerans TaxID=527326 RepID=A0A7J5UTE8_9MICO|nr:nitronate monooxygenase [Georgenia thermotolerans]KAE8765557.1 nitronate monooxygenase [Georgenia thermotolerans]
MLDTWLTDTFGLTVPVIGAPMAGPGEGGLAAAVSAAGGLGMVGVNASRSAAWVTDQAAAVRAVGRPFGIGLMAWGLADRPEQLDAAIAARPPLISISFGSPEPYVARVREAGIRVTAQAGTVEEARRAEAAGVDFVVARGAEGGGHGRGEVATLPLLQSVLDAVAVPVVGAGGIAGPRGLAAVLAAGAAGAWVGTALLGCAEAGTSATARRRLFDTAETGTAYGRVFDVAQGLGWPAEYGGRALRNAFFDAWHGRLHELAGNWEAAEQLRRARAAEDYDTAVIYAGEGVGLLHRERSVAEVLAEFAGAEELLRRF